MFCVFVCGTGTDVGKTHVSRAVLACARRGGRHPLGLKPVESGVCDGAPPTDAAALGAAAGHPPVAPLWSFRDPLSPHLAARRAGKVIEVDAIARWVVEQAAHAEDLVLVESAGGLLSPLSDVATNRDLLLALQPHALLLCAANRLGALHDVAAATEALRAVLRGCVEPVVALSEVVSGCGADLDNAAELRRLGTARRVVAVPHGAIDSPAVTAAAEALLALLGAS